MKEILKEFAVREAGGTAQFARAADPPPRPPGPPPPPPGFASHRGPASFNIGTPRAGSSRDHPAPHYDDDLQDQAERVRDISQGMFRAAFDRAQNNADRNRDDLNAVHQQQWQGHGLGIKEPIKQIQKAIDYYRGRRNPLSKSKQVNRDNLKNFQKQTRDNELKGKRTGSSMEQNIEKFDDATPFDKGAGQHDKYARGYEHRTGFKKKYITPKTRQ